MRDGDLRLRPFRIFDGPCVKSGMNNETALTSAGAGMPFHGSWLSMWWWIKKTYECPFCIELDSTPIGFIGLYHMIPAESADISLVLFEKRVRRKGYGTRAFRLITANLQQYSAVKRIQATARRDNEGALSFWIKMGFSQTAVRDDVVQLTLDVNISGKRHPTFA